MNNNYNNIQRVQISLYAIKLKNVAGVFHGTSDPFCIVTKVASDHSEQPSILGQTEVVKNSLSPQWVKMFELNYEFGRPSRINVSIFDRVDKTNSNKPMGSSMFEVGEVLGKRGNIMAKKLKHGGTLFCRIQRAPDVPAGMLHFTLRGIGLTNMGTFSKSDPFFEIERTNNGSGLVTSQVVYRSEYLKNDLNPKWKPVSIGLDDICNGDVNRPFKISVKDWDNRGKHALMGSFETTVQALLNSKVHSGTGDPKTIDTSRAYKLTQKGGRKPAGCIAVTLAAIEGSGGAMGSNNTGAYSGSSMDQSLPTPIAGGFANALGTLPGGANPLVPMARPRAQSSRRHKFVDYLSGGLEVQLSVAIDFTGSNGDPRQPGSLHYIDSQSLNDYEKALTAVGSIIARYDSDQQFPIYGFGAKFGGVIRHAFQLGPKPQVTGVKGMIDAYRSIFQTGLIMSEPTVFAEVISLAAAQAMSRQDEAAKRRKQSYQVLLILTDGAVTDVQRTKQAIQQAAQAPLSIVIVGIGNADFAGMQFLDDFHEHSANARDICQFVEFQRFQNNRIHLTQATLDEIPTQVVDYFQSHGIAPLPPVQQSSHLDDGQAYNSRDDDLDLSLNFSPNGDVQVTGGGRVDETGYGTYAGLIPMAPPDTSSTQNNITVPTSPPQLFQVQVPPGIGAGQQLQVQNPFTGQTLVVTIPPGIPPGGTFAVSS